MGIAGLPFFNRRSAFLDGGSGAATSTSISSGSASRLRFLLEGGGEVAETSSGGDSSDFTLVDILLFFVFGGADSARVSVMDDIADCVGRRLQKDW